MQAMLSHSENQAGWAAWLPRYKYSGSRTPPLPLLLSGLHIRLWLEAIVVHSLVSRVPLVAGKANPVTSPSSGG